MTTPTTCWLVRDFAKRMVCAKCGARGRHIDVRPNWLELQRRPVFALLEGDLLARLDPLGETFLFTEIPHNFVKTDVSGLDFMIGRSMVPGSAVMCDFSTGL